MKVIWLEKTMLENNLEQCIHEFVLEHVTTGDEPTSVKRIILQEGTKTAKALFVWRPHMMYYFVPVSIASRVYDTNGFAAGPSP